MSSVDSLTLQVPQGMRTVRPPPSQKVEIPVGAEVPFIDPKDPDHKQLQEVWTARTKVFDLGDPDQLDEYQSVWQAITDGTAQISEHRTEFSSQKGSFIALLRWSDISCKVPGKR